WLADEPTTAYREPWRVRAARWVRRRRTLAFAAALGLFLALATLSAATVLLTAAYEEEHLARGREEAARKKEQRARVLERKAREHAEERKKEAEANYQLAFRAVDRYLAQVSNSPELRRHGLEELRRDLLRTALPLFEQLVRRPGSTPDVE